MSRLPIRVRVALLGALTGLVASLLVMLVALWRADSLAKDGLDEFLSLEASEVVALISVGGSFSTLVDVNPSAGPAQRVGLFDMDGNLVDSTIHAPPTPDLTVPGSRYEDVVAVSDGESLRMIVVPLQVEGEPHVLALASSTDFVSSRVLASARSMVPWALLAVVVVGLGSYVITGLVIRPVARLIDSASDLAQSPAGRRLEIPPADDEIRSLATTLNSVLDRIDEVMQQNREFVAQASHELRAPLSRLVADLEFASRPTRTSEEVASGLAVLSTHTEDMMRVADELLDLLEDRTTSTEQARPAARVVEEVLSHTSYYPSLESRTEGDLDGLAVYCDPGQIAGAVRNLIDNAFEHGEEPVSLVITCSRYDIQFRVTDGGPGIPPALHPSIGQPFVRGDDVGKAGLGLAIVARVAARVDGELIIEIEPDSAAIFRLPVFETV